jgi:uncharacterized alpha-E superfamily protein
VSVTQAKANNNPAVLFLLSVVASTITATSPGLYHSTGKMFIIQELLLLDQLNARSLKLILKNLINIYL